MGTLVDGASDDSSAHAEPKGKQERRIHPRAGAAGEKYCGEEGEQARRDGRSRRRADGAAAGPLTGAALVVPPASARAASPTPTAGQGGGAVGLSRGGGVLGMGDIRNRGGSAT